MEQQRDGHTRHSRPVIPRAQQQHGQAQQAQQHFAWMPGMLWPQQQQQQQGAYGYQAQVYGQHQQLYGQQQPFYPPSYGAQPFHQPFQHQQQHAYASSTSYEPLEGYSNPNYNSYYQGSHGGTYASGSAAGGGGGYGSYHPAPQQQGSGSSAGARGRGRGGAANGRGRASSRGGRGGARGSSDSAAPPATGAASPSTSTSAAAPQSQQSATSSSSPSFRCQLNTCNFVGASMKQKVLHEQDRHLIFPPGKEPKPYGSSNAPKTAAAAKSGQAQSGGQGGMTKKRRKGEQGDDDEDEDDDDDDDDLLAMIEGTGIKLDTPESISRWLAERRKRWPTVDVVKAKEEARAIRIKAGLELPPKDWQQQRDRRPPTANANAGERDQGWRGREPQRDVAASSVAMASGESKEVAAAARDAKRRKLANGEGEKLKGDDGDESDSSSSSSSDSSDSDDSSNDESDNDAPPEEESSRSNGPTAATTTTGAADEDKEGDPANAAESLPKESRQVVVCKFWRRTRGRKCPAGQSCKFVHDNPQHAQHQQAARPVRRAPPPPAHNPFARVDALATFAEPDIAQLADTLQGVLLFLRANNWLEGVEMRRGEIDERENRIVDVPQQPADEQQTSQETTQQTDSDEQV